MLQGAEHKLACGCSVLYALNGTVCMSHDIRYCETHSGRKVERVEKLEAVAVAAREMRTCLVVSGDDRVARVHETGCCGLVGAALAALDAVEAKGASVKKPLPTSEDVRGIMGRPENIDKGA